LKNIIIEKKKNVIYKNPIIALKSSL